MPEDNNRPLTVLEFREFEQRQEARFAQIDQRFTEMFEFIRDTETRLLTAMHDYLTVAGRRMSELEDNDKALSRRVESIVERLALMEDRLLRVERRLDLGPEQR